MTQSLDRSGVRIARLQQEFTATDYFLNTHKGTMKGPQKGGLVFVDGRLSCQIHSRGVFGFAVDVDRFHVVVGRLRGGGL